MGPEARADSLNEIHLMDPVHVDPRHRGRLLEGETLLDGLHLAFLELRFVVINERDADLLRPLLADVDKRPRRKSGRLGNALHDRRHGSSPI